MRPGILLHVALSAVVVLSLVLLLTKSPSRRIQPTNSLETMDGYLTGSASMHGLPAAKSVDPKSMDISIGSHAHWATDGYRNEMKEIITSSSNEIKRVMELDYTKTLAGDGMYSRALVAFFDPASQKYKTEIKALLLSIAWMRLSQPPTIKTDVLIYAPERAHPYLVSIGCVMETRTSFGDPERCLFASYLPLAERVPSATLGEDPMKTYKFAESHNVVGEMSDELYYDLVVRSDLDTFFTSNFASYIPAPGVTVIGYGGGGYESKHAMEHMKYIMNYLGLRNSNIVGLGSSWYGPMAIVKRVSKLSVDLMRWLYTQEYTEYDRQCFCWPEWYWVVTTMYSGHMALHQLGPERLLFDKIDQVLFDGWSNGPMTPAVMHMHCWHSNKFYSKLDHHAGKYADMDLTPHLDFATREAYTGVLAISAERLTEEEFSTYINDPDAIRDKKWIRAFPVKH